MPQQQHQVLCVLLSDGFLQSSHPPPPQDRLAAPANIRQQELTNGSEFERWRGITGMHSIEEQKAQKRWGGGGSF